MEASHDAIVGHDGNGHVTSWNAAAERILGWTPAQALGRDLFQLLAVPGQPEAMRQARPQVFAGRSVPPFDAQGRDVPVSVSLAPIVVQRLVALMDGQLVLDSAPGRGSRFSVTLARPLPGTA